MKWFMNLKIAVKLIVSFVVVAIIAALIGGIGLFYTNSIGENTLPSVRYLLEVRSNLAELSMHDNLLLSPKLSYEERQDAYEEIVSLENDIAAAIEEVSNYPLSNEEQRLWDEAQTEIDIWLEDHSQFIAMSKNMDDIGIDDPALVSYEIALKTKDHYKWISTLEDDIIHGREFTGQLDGTQCALGHWLEKYSSRNAQFDTLMAEIHDAHMKVHSSGEEINDIMGSNRGNKLAAATAVYDNVTKANMDIVLAKLSEMDDLANTSDNLFNQMVEYSLGTLDASFDSAEDKVKTLLNSINDGAHDGVTSAKTMMIVLIFVGVALSLALGFIISKIIKQPISILVDAANEIKNGNLDIDTQIKTKDELGQLAKSFDDMTNNINDVMSNINSASDQVAAGARQVSDSSINLSQGATEQASSVEQLTASIDEIAAQTRQNADNANEAKVITATAQEFADQGNQQMDAMLGAMSEINESSNNISKIIKVIDDIASQTNILSLNAAVEAARAGQHGKGFAVVAEEVRNLAARSAEAAKETTAMIESSMQKVEDGTKIAKDTADALTKIVEGVAKATDLVSDIAVASNEQAAGIDQINQGVTEISTVVQSTSATSEETATASEQLSGQADTLKSQVATFKLKDTSNLIKATYKNMDKNTPNEPKLPDHKENKKRLKKQKKVKDIDLTKKDIDLTDMDFGKY